MDKFNKIFAVLLFIIVGFFASNIFAATTQINAIQAINFPKNNSTNIIFDLRNQPRYTAFFINNPPRLVIDLQNANNVASLNRSILRNTQIENIRFGKHENNSLRVVLDLKKPLFFKHYVLSQGKIKKLVVELYSSKPKPISPPKVIEKKIPVKKIVEQKKPLIEKPVSKPIVTTKPLLVPSVKTPASAVQKEVSAAPAKIDLTPTLSFAGSKNPSPLKSHEIVVVIDPGHGGRDAGAHGLGGTLEKEVVLEVAKSLQAYLNNTPGFKAILTRTGDYHLPLHERLRIAHENKADLFVSIHADIYKKSYRVNGTSVFALSQKGATTEAASWLAKQENVSELGKDDVEKSNTLRSVLIDLAENATIKKSLEIGDVILKQLNDVTHLHSKEVEQAAFVVLQSPEIPSLLVEVGFLSDPHEEVLLRDKDYEHKFANTMGRGIINYFLLAQKSNSI